jgi:Histidinol-phosphate/aromatic aminotransferase and cobyric acid decarboxylase
MNYNTNVGLNSTLKQIKNKKESWEKMTIATAFHGSDIDAIEQHYHMKRENIINFSANVNPLGISKRLKDALAQNIDVIGRYPDRHYITLRKSIATYTGTDFNHILVGNGSTELISLVIQIKQPKNCLLLGPTYSEYERELELARCHIAHYNLKEHDDFQFNFTDFENKLSPTLDMIILCNPNNPTSTCIGKQDLEKLLNICKQYHILVMIDETYIEFAPQMENITAASFISRYDNLVVLRGVAKFFASPGLRLGYALMGDLDLLNQINEQKNPWSINSLAEYAGTIMFSDEEYITKTRDFINTELDFMYQALKKLPKLKVYKPIANFILVRLKNETASGKDFFEFCIKRGIMIRDCSTFHSLEGDYVRFCIMNTNDNRKLLACFEKYFSAF